MLELMEDRFEQRALDGDPRELQYAREEARRLEIYLVMMM